MIHQKPSENPDTYCNIGELDVPIMRDGQNVLDLMIGTSLKELVIIKGASHYFRKLGKLEELFKYFPLNGLKLMYRKRSLFF